MDIFINLDTRRLQRSVAISQPPQPAQLNFKRGDAAEIVVRFVRNNIQEALASGSVITFCCKERDKYDGDALVLTDDFTLSGSGATAAYTANPSFNTEPLDDALFKDGDDENDVAYADIMGEITWTDGPGGAITSTETISVRVDNDVFRGDEGTPTALPDPDDWMPAALAITCPPNTPQTLAITGTLTNTDTSSITVPVSLLYAGMVGGKPMWSADGTTGASTNYCKWLPSASPFPKWELKLSTGYTASTTSDKGLPSGLTFTASIGTGTPTVTAGAIIQGSALGQLAQYTSAGGTVYSFRTTDLSPMTWEAATPGVLWNTTLEIWRKMTLSGIDGSESPEFTSL